MNASFKKKVKFRDGRVGQLTVRDGGLGQLTIRDGGVGQLTIRDGGVGQLTIRDGGVGQLTLRDGEMGQLTFREEGVGQLTHNSFFFLAAVNVHLWTEKAPREKSKKKMLRVLLLRQNKMANGLMGEWL